MALSHTNIAKAKILAKQYRLSDGQGLYLLVHPGGRKYWRSGYSLLGKRKIYAIGVFPAISLKQARAERDRVQSLVAQGIDPVKHRREKRVAAIQAIENTFGRLAEEWFDNKKPGWSSGHVESIRQRLDNHILPYLASTPCEEINPLLLLLLPVLRRLEQADKI